MQSVSESLAVVNSVCRECGSARRRARSRGNLVAHPVQNEHGRLEVEVVSAQDQLLARPDGQARTRVDKKGKRAYIPCTVQVRGSRVDIMPTPA